MNQSRERLPVLLSQLQGAYGMERLLQRDGAAAEYLDPSFVEAFLEVAAKVTDEVLEPFDRRADEQGARFEAGRVYSAPGHREAWATYVEGGWLGMQISEQYGGQGLPGILSVMAEDILDQGSVSFGMLAAATRFSTVVLEKFASQALCDEWIPQLAAGQWGATICISEPGAGSDVGRIRTRAKPLADDVYSIVGDKCWISFGDHDLSERIGHMLLARIEGAEPGVRGLSLFLVPNTWQGDDGSFQDNGVVVQRIEEKMGLHASPTCVLAYEDSKGYLIGEPGRGLPQLFHMIVNMRLQVGAQGVGLATRAYQAALSYAHERRQGGRPDQGPVPIIEHADVKLQLMTMSARIESLRALLYSAGVTADLANRTGDDAANQLLSWLLPIVKNGGAELAYGVSSDALMVFGGAGYTREWPVEQYVRDARILAIYEGTTAMQAQDVLRRQWLVDDGGFHAFVSAVQDDASRSSGAARDILDEVLSIMVEADAYLREHARESRAINALARSALYVATEASLAWMAARIVQSDNEELKRAGECALIVQRQKMKEALSSLTSGTAQALLAI